MLASVYFLGRYKRLKGCLAGHGVLQQLSVLLTNALEDGTLDCSDAMVSAVALASLRSLPRKLLEDLAALAARDIDSCTTVQVVHFLRLLAVHHTPSGVTHNAPPPPCLANACGQGFVFLEARIVSSSDFLGCLTCSCVLQCRRTGDSGQAA
jgi:hypothetical protein